MKKDIKFLRVEGVSIAITRETIANEKEFDWNVHLINNNDFALTNVIINSRGYGTKDGEEQKTSILRHLIENVDAKSTAQIEKIDPSVFHLTNQYWISYYIEREIYDKKFIFVPDTIIEANLTFIPELNKEGILHN